MCFGGPQAPKIVYQGPSRESLRANELQIQQYQESSRRQQDQFTASLQKQIDQANTQITQQEAQLSAEMQAASAQAAAQQQAAYATTVTTAEPVDPVVTQAAKPREKPRASLRISLNDQPAAAGAGLNIGV